VNHAPIKLKPGDSVDVVGFAQPGGFTAEMRDAEISRLGNEPPPRPARITVDEALGGTHDAELVEIDALLVDQIVNGSQSSLVLHPRQTVPRHAGKRVPGRPRERQHRQGDRDMLH